MKKLMFVMLAVIAVGAIRAAIAILDAPDPPAQPGAPCAVPAGFSGGTTDVTWNPISEPGRCAGAVATVVVDNGTTSTLHVLLDANDLPVAQDQHLVIHTIVGPFALDVTREGAVIAHAKLVLSAGHTYVYAPNMAWSYARRTYTYEQRFIGEIGGEGPKEEPLPEGDWIDAGIVDLVFAVPPENGEVGTHRVALQRIGNRRVGSERVAGDVRVIGLDGARAIVTGRALGVAAPRASIYLDNVDAKRALPVALDGVPIAEVPAGKTFEIVAPAGKHELAATLAKTTERETITTAAGDRWIWTPTRRRDYVLDQVGYGLPVFVTAPPPRARALPPFKTHADFVFQAPASIPGRRSFQGATRSVLKLGDIGDYHREIAGEIRALGGSADEATASECDLVATKRAKHVTGTEVDSVAHAFCE